jgi:hypothetical protein
MGLHNIFWHNFSIYLSNFFNLSSEKEYPYLPLPFYYTPAPPEGGILFYLCPSVCPRYFFQQLLMAEIWYLVTSFHIQNVCSMCIKINKVGKQEVGIWWVQKRFPRYGVPIWSLWPNIRFLSSIVAGALAHSSSCLNFSLCKILVYSEFSFDRFHCIFES